MSVRTQIKLVIIISIHEILLLLLVGYLRQKVRTKPRDLLNRMTEKKCARQKTAKISKAKRTIISSNNKKKRQSPCKCARLIWLTHGIRHTMN